MSVSRILRWIRERLAGPRRRFRRLRDKAALRLLYGAQRSRRVDWPGLCVADLEHLRVLVVAAHPDDEVIGAGGLLSRLKRAGVVIVADGSRRRRRGVTSPTEGLSAEARRAEAAAALALLPNAISPSIHLQMVDQDVVFRIVDLVDELLEIIRANRIEAIVTHPYEGGHPDHDACAAAVHAACMLLDAEERPRLIEMTSYHAAGNELVVGRFLDQPGGGAVDELRLSRTEERRKRAMFDCYPSQAGLLSGFPTDVESFRAAPSYNFIGPPHPGKLLYEQNNWYIDGYRWRVVAARALSRLRLLEKVRN